MLSDMAMNGAGGALEGLSHIAPMMKGAKQAQKTMGRRNQRIARHEAHRQIGAHPLESSYGTSSVQQALQRREKKIARDLNRKTRRDGMAMGYVNKSTENPDYLNHIQL